MTRITKLGLIGLSLVVGASAMSAQAPPKACGYIGTATVAKLAKCLDSLTVKAKLWEAQGRPTMADFYTKLPPNGLTVAEYVAGAGSGAPPAPPSSSMGNTVNGDLVITGRLCVGRPCIPGNEVVQILQQNDAEILFVSNLSGGNPQGAAPHASVLAGSGDGGIRIIHNYRNGLGWQEPAKPRSILAFDSQGTLSLSQDKNGVIYPSQSVILWLDDASKTASWRSMKQGWKWEMRESTTGNNTFDRIVFPSVGGGTAQLPADITARSFTLVNDAGPVVTWGLSGNNEKPQRLARSSYFWAGSYPNEIDTHPGPALNCTGNICGEFMQWGPQTADGTKRKRLTLSLQGDAAGGISGMLDATTNDPSGSLAQKTAAPLCFNAGEGVGMFICLYAGDNTIDLQDRVAGVSTGRIPFAQVIERLR